MQVDNVKRLTSGQLSDVLRLVEAATEADRVAPLSEHTLLATRHGPSDTSTVTKAATGSAGISSAGISSASTPTSAPHFLAYDGPHLAGYAHLERGTVGADATAEVVVDPRYRRQGVGTMLVNALETALNADPAQNPDPALNPDPPLTVECALKADSTLNAEPVTLRLWSHGHLDGASAFAVRDGYSITRELWQMCRGLRSVASPLPAAHVPEGFRVRRFVVGQDEDAWLALNAKAFVDHPEQGAMTRDDLDQRIAEPWFDAGGLILIEDTNCRPPALAASHWTKIVPDEASPVGPTQGEVYVVGVDPAYQGKGLGRAVTLLGLAHLRGKGMTEAMLYVDADNSAAIATYSGLGFERCAVDVMYSRTVHLPVSR